MLSCLYIGTSSKASRGLEAFGFGMASGPARMPKTSAAVAARDDGEVEWIETRVSPDKGKAKAKGTLESFGFGHK